MTRLSEVLFRHQHTVHISLHWFFFLFSLVAEPGVSTESAH